MERSHAMSYFIADVKRIYKSRMVQLTLLLMGIIAVADPLFVRFVYGRHPGFFEQVGANPFQFWLLMNSSGWGHTVYRTLLFIFPVLSTGLIFFHERHSSMYELMVSRKSRRDIPGLRWRGCHNSAASFYSCAAGFPPSL